MAAPKEIGALTAGWVFDDVHDNQPLPGAFISYLPEQDFTVHFGPRTLTVRALNYTHAVYTGWKRLAAENGGDTKRCELCGAHLRYAAMFFDAAERLHVVGSECAERIQSGLSNHEAWVIVASLKEAKTVNTKFGPRRKVDLFEPEGWRFIPYAERPRFVSMWTPKPQGSYGRTRRYWTPPKPRLTVWAKDDAELMDNVRALRTMLRNRGMNTAVTVKPRRIA